MPANRSRTENWTTSLCQIAERGGSLELAIVREAELDGGGVAAEGEEGGEHAPDLLWRVKLLRVDERLIVECPAAAGSSVRLTEGTGLVASMTIGQNRWVFRTEVVRAGERHLELAVPTKVERCSRREFVRAGTSIRLPDVRCYPLRDPMSTVGFESAFRDLAEIAGGQISVGGAVGGDVGLNLPELGPSFGAKLLNISGGGIGLLVPSSSSALLDAAPFLWMQIDLRPDLPAPLAVAARRAHQHLDAQQNLCVGLAFEFASHPEHQRFVTESLLRYVGSLVHQKSAARAA